MVPDPALELLREACHRGITDARNHKITKSRSWNQRILLNRGVLSRNDMTSHNLMHNLRVWSEHLEIWLESEVSSPLISWRFVSSRWVIGTPPDFRSGSREEFRYWFEEIAHFSKIYHFHELCQFLQYESLKNSIFIWRGCTSVLRCCTSYRAAQ